MAFFLLLLTWEGQFSFFHYSTDNFIDDTAVYKGNQNLESRIRGVKPDCMLVIHSLKKWHEIRLGYMQSCHFCHENENVFAEIDQSQDCRTFWKELDYYSSKLKFLPVNQLLRQN